MKKGLHHSPSLRTWTPSHPRCSSDLLASSEDQGCARAWWSGHLSSGIMRKVRMKEGQSSVHSIESTGPYSEIMSFLPFFWCKNVLSIIKLWWWEPRGFFFSFSFLYEHFQSWWDEGLTTFYIMIPPPIFFGRGRHLLVCNIHVNQW